MAGPCPTEESLATALRGSKALANDGALAAHLSECELCRAKLESLAGGSAWIKAGAGLGVSEPRSEWLEKAIRDLEVGPNLVEESDANAKELDFLEPVETPGFIGKFGSYLVIEHVASGGMGIVLKARDPGLDRIVALKLLPRALAANSLARARFVREARAAAAVVHENVAPIYAVGEHAGLPYLVMQFVNGRPLSERIRVSGALRVDEILRIGAQTAAGLAAAHAQGLVHRDVKPGNILLENSVERVKLTDFGLAQAADEVGLTRTGELAGTPEYMAPEQAGSETVDQRADLFSLGSVLYAMSTGRSPFQGNSVIAVVRKVCDENPPLAHELNPAIPLWLSDIIKRLMEKRPEDRFQSAQELRELLELYLARVQRGELGEISREQIETTAVGFSRMKLALAAGIILLLGLTPLLFVKFGRHPLKTEVRAAAPSEGVAAAPFVALTAKGERLGGFADLREAAEKTPAGGIVELCWDGPNEMTPLQLPAKALTLRAGKGFRPVWISKSDSAAALSASAPLVIDGIRFVLEANSPGAFRGGGPGQFPTQKPRVAPSGVALVSITNAPLRIAQCTLELRIGGAFQLSCVNFENGATCRIENSFLLARLAKGILWRQKESTMASALTLSNCVLFAAEAIWLDFNQSARPRLELTRCTFSGPSSIYLPPSFKGGELQILASRNVFDSGALIADAREADSPPIAQWIRWREEENLHSPARRYILSISSAENGPSTLKEWNHYWNQAENGSRHGNVKLGGAFTGGNARSPRMVNAPDDFKMIGMEVTEGPPLKEDQWRLYGAEVSAVGPGAR
jgi:hypothetical protein